METYNIKKRIKREKPNKKWTEDEINKIILKIFKCVLFKYKMTTFKKTIMNTYMACLFHIINYNKCCKVNQKKKTVNN